MKMMRIFCKNNGTYYDFPAGSGLREIYDKAGLDMPYGVTSAKVNNVSRSLSAKIYADCDVEYIDVTDPSGMRTYIRSLFFVLCAAVEDTISDARVLLEHAVSNGYYCDLRLDREITLEDVARIKERMLELIEQDMPFIRMHMHTEDAVGLFLGKGMFDKVKLLRSRGSVYSDVYTLGTHADFYYGNLLPSTGYIKVFDLVKYYDGLLLSGPSKSNPHVTGEVVKQEKMLEVFHRNLRWLDVLSLSNVGDLNEAVDKGDATDIIKVTEALQEKLIGNIADDITEHFKDCNVGIVLISGPSSSGKTTFSKRLSIQLMANGVRPYPVSLDNYFKNREDTPLDENGEYDFESLYALDLDLFNSQMRDVMSGEEVALPTYDFIAGKRVYKGDRLKLEKGMVLILEGIHALNPELTSGIDDALKYRVYVSALTSISLDDHNPIPTTDNRLLRRILRDYKTRGYSAKDTIGRWESVRNGENKWIFPYQENADVMFNSALLYELAVLRPLVEPVLMSVPEDCSEYGEAYRLLRFLQYFKAIRSDEIPPTSLIREFLGGSSFKY